METFSPSVLIDGKTVYPPGWMYIFAYALNGFQWAIDECEKPEFKQIVKDWLLAKKRFLNQQKIEELEQHIKNIQTQIEKLKGEL